MARTYSSPDSARRAPLYRADLEHDACGTGFVADLSGQPSHLIVRQGLEAIANLAHRGAVDADGRTGDGAGIMLQIPRRLLAREAERLTGQVVDPSTLAAGMIFLPGDDPITAAACRDALGQALLAQGVPALAWRQVPVRIDELGSKARLTVPDIRQVIVSRPAGLDELDFERRLYLARKQAERVVAAQRIEGFHVASLSSRTIVYKGLMLAQDLPNFYDDLRDPDCESALALFHQRYSTNTFPSWALAQPFRRLGHNGEINTLQGNRNWMRAREPEFVSRVWGDRVGDLVPVIDPAGSDSTSLDNVLELLDLSGRDLLHAMAMLVPEAWENMPAMPEDLRAFYAYHAALMEPWDGPAALAFTDGQIVGAALDRNGLRPSRYSITEDGLVVVASETGVLDLGGRTVVERGRLGPGQMVAADLKAGRFLSNDAIKQELASRRPYQRWVSSGLRALAPVGLNGNGQYKNGLDLLTRQLAVGFSGEDQRLIINPMAAEEKEPLWSMGDDAPLAVLSTFPRPLAHFFRQRFAQVTNPPIDPLRESLVMALDTYLGPRGSVLEETPEQAKLLHLRSPILTEHELDQLTVYETSQMHSARLDASFPVAGNGGGLAAALARLVREAEAAIDRGCTLLVLSDRRIDATLAPIPMPLAVGAVHHGLIEAGKRLRASIICDTADVWDVHQAMVLIGYGASAIQPYLAMACARGLAGTRGLEEASASKLEQAYQHMLEYGLRKVMSKMGISAISSYQGAQLFEVLGLDQSVVDHCFAGTPSRLGGLDLTGIEKLVLTRHQQAFVNPPSRLPDYGMVRFRRDGEYHQNSPTNVRALQQAVKTREQEHYAAFVRQTHERQPALLRDLMRFKAATPVPLDEVEPAEEIRRRFVVTAMSLGALSPEAYRTLAIAMNRMGARSNSGEGGEDPDWYDEPGPDIAHSKIKQVASGRFGVTATYLSRAIELEIKMAQGSKPGEGGQLPSHKVTPFIARLRHAVPGIALISPPPHHDIYSIEDLAQLIYDLKRVNPRAQIGVKLVSQVGVGTVAAGVAKAHADYVLISGHSGGTGASPLSSIKHVGVPWELGLAETQQTLVINDLRGRVRLRTDGGLQTARDIVIAALLGAEEFGIGTAALVAIGCDMARQCHLNTCPTGIATQRADLRAKFAGTPEHVIAYFTHLADEVRELMAQLGVRRMDDLIGRVDLLEAAEGLEGPAAMLDLTSILTLPGDENATRRCVVDRNDDALASPPLDDEIAQAVAEAVAQQMQIRIEHGIQNHERTVGGRLAGDIAYRYGQQGLPPGTIEVKLKGTAGQSFGAWSIGGMRLLLEGEANDYVGKGMSGGEIAIYLPEGAAAQENGRSRVILGNTVLYGATGGELYAAGQAGERFAVRNSGAVAVVEGLGDHGCEYMTGGTVVVLGATGRNFGAGMTNGIAFVLDEAGTLPERYNPESIELQRIVDSDQADQLRSLIERHVEITGSQRGRAVLDAWEQSLGRFWVAVPRATEQPPVQAEPARTLERRRRVAS